LIENKEKKAKVITASFHSCYAPFFFFILVFFDINTMRAESSRIHACMHTVRIVVNITIGSGGLPHSFFLYIYIYMRACIYVPIESKATIKLDVVSGTRKKKKSSRRIKKCSLVIVLLHSMTYAVGIDKCVYSLVYLSVVIVGSGWDCCVMCCFFRLHFCFFSSSSSVCIFLKKERKRQIW
jgi:hypothetical protein